LQASDGKTLDFQVLRGGKTIELRTILETIEVDGTTVGFLTVRASDRVFVPLGLDQAAIEAAAKT
jgi:hypothetical protein